ncbi:PD40 domain-containing protein [Ochrobactrum sp. Marseille-Q0166]|uniref:PD40 domain-containing protein n=1 Tax=Ochrobactrum sp. Marseille-Q0166 TaxID=2761105 RepID=UPI00165597AB|nr:PD40 domain-containing protein [Ochrobactrum sp. Marseille-Q0166]MBC8720035.1 PD40 domain-containing protein [Ochrobactrum sp. Marseille-Q0166]
MTKYGFMIFMSVITLAISLPSQTFADFTGQPTRWVQKPARSPDAKLIAFTHRGQVFLTDNDGGLAFPTSPSGAYSHSVVWAPDSKRLAFASDVNGDDDVYVAVLSDINAFETKQC